MLVNIFDGVWNSGYLMSGGRNLALETNQNATNWDWVMKTGGASLTENIENDVKIVKFVRDTTEMTEWSVLYYKNLALQQFEPDTYYTISVDINPSVDTTFRCCIVKLNAKDWLILQDWTTSYEVKSNKWNTIHMTLKNNI